MLSFEPTLQTARARLAAVDPDAYARTRNALDGAVTRLSPYLTHGFLSLREVYAAVHARHPLDVRHKLVFELGWRAYWRHVWSHRGDGIHQSIHAGLLPDDAYQPEIPADVLAARTGIPAIDVAVQELYGSGYLHNHARMWLASYLVHLRKVHWHAGAQWMLGHLLDGDVASNHLSWQWVAGTGSSKPYLFNADNVARYAPPQWHSPGTVIDTSYETMDLLARRATPEHDPGETGRARDGVLQPALRDTPPGSDWQVPNPQVVQGCDVRLIHPWSIGGVPFEPDAGVVTVGVGFTEAHAQTPWSERRWSFVSAGLRAHTPHLWWGSTAQVAQALSAARSVTWQPDPHAAMALNDLRKRLATCPATRVIEPRPQAPLFETVETHCTSFTRWWRRTRIADSA